MPAKYAKLDAAEQTLLLEDLQSPCTEEVAGLRDCRWREKPRSIEFLMWTSQKWTGEIIGPCCVRSPDLAAVKLTVGLACRHLPKVPQNGANFGGNASRQDLNLADIAPAPQGKTACPRNGLGASNCHANFTNISYCMPRLGRLDSVPFHGSRRPNTQEKSMTIDTDRKRRTLLKSVVVATGAFAAPLASRLAQAAAPAVVVADGDRPLMEQGIQFGDMALGRTMLWSRADRPARLQVEYALDPGFGKSVRRVGPHALDTTDYTARIDLTGLPAERTVYVRAWFESLTNKRASSASVAGSFRTPGLNRNVRFVWGGDTAGQGWGINTSFGGMKIYESMRRVQPDFFIHSGDTIYADGPIEATRTAEGGRLWTNLVTPEVSKVAETLAEFRGRYKYNLLDENVRRFNAEVPQIWQWDDHEVTNNWSGSKDLSSDTRYTVKDVPLLVARGTRAFQEFAPMRPHTAEETERVYRHVAYGPLLDVFVIDMRTYRGPNTANLQLTEGPDTEFLGAAQIEWLTQALQRSRATWKVIAADMPIGLNVGDGRDAQNQLRWEAIANGNNGPARGRELEIARVLQSIKRNNVKNVVWMTADVHYCAAHYYDPAAAQFQDFAPFWEFVAGPLNAGTFGPGTLDATFGPQLVFFKAPPAGQFNLSPFAGLQFFGEASIDAASRSMTVAFKDIDGSVVFTKTLAAG